MLKISNRLIKEAAEKRGWPVEILSEEAGLLMLSMPNGKKLVVHSSLSPFTPATAVEIADDKFATYLIAREYEVPAVETQRITNESEALSLLAKYKEIVIKPAGEAHGNGVSTQLTEPSQVQEAYKIAADFESGVIGQPHLKGHDLRLLYVGGKLAAAAIRHPASILGDGQHSIREIISIENSSGKRAPDYQKNMNLIDVKAVERFLGDTIDTPTEAGKHYIVVGTANIGTGGTAEDISSSVNPKIVEDGLKILLAIGLETGAADFITEDDSHMLLEVNANPSLGLHTFPTIGEGRDVASMYLDWLVNKTE